MGMAGDGVLEGLAVVEEGRLLHLEQGARLRLMELFDLELGGEHRAHGPVCARDLEAEIVLDEGVDACLDRCGLEVGNDICLLYTSPSPRDS